MCLARTWRQGEFVAGRRAETAPGKTTLFKTILRRRPHRLRGPDHLQRTGPARGAARPSAARISASRMCCRKGRQVFASMSVMENPGKWGRLYAKGGASAGTKLLPMILALFPILSERRDQLAGTLFGRRTGRWSRSGRGLASAPTFLMLDEPSMGLAPAIVDAIFDRIHQHSRRSIHPHHPAGRAGASPRRWRTCGPRLCARNRGAVAMQGTHQTLIVGRAGAAGLSRHVNERGVRKSAEAERQTRAKERRTSK